MPPLALAADQRSVNTGLATAGGFRPQADGMEKPSMKRSRYLLLVGALLGIAAVSVWAWREIAIDRCLDNGGRWNYQGSKCEMQR